MIEKREPLIVNDRSLINHQWLTSDDMAIIAIYGHGNSRTIYIESGQECRTINKYAIVFPVEGHEYDRAEGWVVSTPLVASETAVEIRKLRKISGTSKEIQVTHEEMLLFKATLDDAAKARSILLGTQDISIEMGLEKIGQSIHFTQPRTCIIS